MPDCNEVRRLLAPYVDQEASRAEREVVEAHLGHCPPCAAWATAEASARRLLLVRGASLGPRAPEALRSRCVVLACSCRGPHGRTHRWILARPWVTAATSVAALVAGVLFYGSVSGSSTVLAAEMALDHLKCFGLFEARSGPDDPRALAARLAADPAWHLSIPPGLATAGLRLVGGRRCLSTDGAVAHLMYRHGDRPVSLFVVARAHQAAALTLAGYVTRVWSGRGRTYVVVASESEEAAAPVLDYFAAELR